MTRTPLLAFLKTRVVQPNPRKERGGILVARRVSARETSMQKKKKKNECELTFICRALGQPFATNY